MGESIVIHTLTTGDPVVWRPVNRSIAVEFTGPRKVLSTSLLNGGYQEKLIGVFNHNCGPDNGSMCELRASTYLEHMRLVWASLWSDRALLYRRELNLDVRRSAMAVLIQALVPGDRSGVAFSRNPLNDAQAVIEAVHGLNEGLVDGTVLEFKVTTPEGKVLTSNMKVSQADLDLLKQIQDSFS